MLFYSIFCALSTTTCEPVYKSYGKSNGTIVSTSVSMPVCVREEQPIDPDELSVTNCDQEREMEDETDVQ